jgi:tRNA G10  N-methylase Trm11
MTKYVFILGKNWTLSLAELVVYLQDRNLAEGLDDYTRTMAVVDIEEKLTDQDLVEMLGALGGCFKVGRVISVYDRSLVEEAFPAKGRVQNEARMLLKQLPWVQRIWPKLGGKKVKFAVSTYSMLGKQTTIDLRKLTLGLDDWTKKQLVKLGAKKAVYYVYEGPDKRGPDRPNVALWPKSIARHKLLSPPNAEVLVALGDSSVYIAKTIGVYDSMLQQYRDESRPYISEEISTSPKVCRTLLTLAGARPGDTILDPFCGSGTLLMEAALLGMKCIGIDIDGNTANGARQNMRWLASDLGESINFTIIKGDARNVDNLVKGKIDAVAFEPDLGPVYSERPTKEEAEENILELTKLYRTVLQKLGGILRPEGRIAMSLPVVNAQGGQILVDIEELTRETDFRVMKMLPKDSVESAQPRNKLLAISPNRATLPERKRGQVVERSIVMLGRG